MEKNSEEVAFLVTQTGLLEDQRWALHQDILIGRDAKCDIVIVDRQVSRHHQKTADAYPPGIARHRKTGESGQKQADIL